MFQINKLNTLFIDHVEEGLRNLFRNDRVRVFFDLSNVKFIDSSGFQMLHRISEFAEKSGSEFILCNITDEVEELVNLMNIGDRLRFEHRDLRSEPILLEVE